MQRILLVNANTSAETTARMLGIAGEIAPAGVSLAGLTVPFGVPLITTEAQLAVAEEAVLTATPAAAAGADAVLVAAFGDPGVEQLRAALGIPVIGIAEAAFAAAAVL